MGCAPDAPVFASKARTWAKLLSSAAVAQACKHFIVEPAHRLGLQSPELISTIIAENSYGMTASTTISRPAGQLRLTPTSRPMPKVTAAAM